MDKFKDQVRTIVCSKIIVNAGYGRVVKGGQDVGFPLKVLDDIFPHQWIGGTVNHLFYSHQLHDAGEMQVTGAINRTHASHADYFLDNVSAYKGYPGSQLLVECAIR